LATRRQAFQSSLRHAGQKSMLDSGRYSDDELSESAPRIRDLVGDAT
jgi:hypothetical protein